MVIGHDIPWDLRDITRVAAGNPDNNPASSWGDGGVIGRTRRVVAEWCANHVGPVEIVETGGVKVLRFSSAADLIVFRLRWL